MATIELHHILVKSPLLAQDILNELELGREFSDLAREFSCCPSKNNAGNTGLHDQSLLPENIIQALVESPDDAPYTQAVQSHFGYHILKPVGQKPDAIFSDKLANKESHGIEVGAKEETHPETKAPVETSSAEQQT